MRHPTICYDPGLNREEIQPEVRPCRGLVTSSPVTLPANLAAATYHVLIQLTDTTGIVETFDSGHVLKVNLPPIKASRPRRGVIQVLAVSGPHGWGGIPLLP